MREKCLDKKNKNYNNNVVAKTKKITEAFLTVPTPTSCATDN